MTGFCWWIRVIGLGIIWGVVIALLTGLVSYVLALIPFEGPFNVWEAILRPFTIAIGTVGGSVTGAGFLHRRRAIIVGGVLMTLVAVVNWNPESGDLEKGTVATLSSLVGVMVACAFTWMAARTGRRHDRIGGKA